MNSSQFFVVASMQIQRGKPDKQSRCRTTSPATNLAMPVWFGNSQNLPTSKLSATRKLALGSYSFECRRGLEGHSATGLALDARSTPTTAISGITQDGFFKETTGIYSPVSSRPHHFPVLFLSLGVVKSYR